MLLGERCNALATARRLAPSRRISIKVALSSGFNWV
jgi:hypothetical protein